MSRTFRITLLGNESDTKLNAYKSNRDLIKFNQENKNENKLIVNDHSFYASIENTTQELSMYFTIIYQHTKSIDIFKLSVSKLTLKSN